MSLDNLLHIYERNNTTSPQSPGNRYRGITSYMIDALIFYVENPKESIRKAL